MLWPPGGNPRVWWIRSARNQGSKRTMSVAKKGICSDQARVGSGWRRIRVASVVIAVSTGENLTQARVGLCRSHPREGCECIGVKGLVGGPEVMGALSQHTRRLVPLTRTTGFLAQGDDDARSCNPLHRTEVPILGGRTIPILKWFIPKTGSPVPKGLVS